VSLCIPARYEGVMLGAFRACTETMPAHIDGDSDWPQVPANVDNRLDGVWVWV